MPDQVDLYDNVYASFESRAEAAVRHSAFGEDIGQSSWLTAAEWLRFADLVQVHEHSHVLEVGSGSGGPAVYLAAARGCAARCYDCCPTGARSAALPFPARRRRADDVVPPSVRAYRNPVRSRTILHVPCGNPETARQGTAWGRLSA